MDLTHPLSSAWTLEPAITYLNHGAFGACPRPVLARQAEWRAQLEREPTQFFEDALEPGLDAARGSLGELVGADPDDLAFLNNATQGVNTVLRALRFETGDEILVTSHGYNACTNAAASRAAEGGANVVVAEIPFPLTEVDQIVQAVLGKLSARTRLLLIDHVTSPSGLVFPIAGIAAAARDRGVAVLVDGAHAPGMVPVDLAALGEAGVGFYTANCHKWLCAPKGAAFLWVRRDLQPGFRPLSVSHGANSQRTDRSRFRLEFDWTGTDDPTPFLCVPDAIAFLEGLVPGGLPALRERNRALALAARTLLCDALGIATPSPESTIGALASVPLPPGALSADALHRALFADGIEVPVYPWPAPEKRTLRVSAQGYNALPDYERLVSRLAARL